MKHRFTPGPVARMALALCLATGSSAASLAAPLMSVEAQALAHWVHYTRLNENRQHADAPFIVLDASQLRWWLLDATGRWSGYGPVLPLLAVDRSPLGLQPVSPDAPAARERWRSNND